MYENMDVLVVIFKPPSAIDHPTFIHQQKAGRARGPSKAKSLAPVKDEEEQKGVKSKPVPAHNRRGPVVSKSQSQVRTETTR